MTSRDHGARPDLAVRIQDDASTEYPGKSLDEVIAREAWGYRDRHGSSLRQGWSPGEHVEAEQVREIYRGSLLLARLLPTETGEPEVVRLAEDAPEDAPEAAPGPVTFRFVSGGWTPGSGWRCEARVWSPSAWAATPPEARPEGPLEGDVPGWFLKIESVGPTDGQVSEWAQVEAEFADIGLRFDRRTGDPTWRRSGGPG